MHKACFPGENRFSACDAGSTIAPARPARSTRMQRRPQPGRSHINNVMEKFEMATAKKAPAKKAAAKKAPVKKAPAKKRTPNAAFLRPLTPSAALAAIVGDKPLPRTEITKRVWDYIKSNKLQDAINRRLINADARLREVVKKAQVTMFELTKLISAQLK